MHPLDNPWYNGNMRRLPEFCSFFIGEWLDALNDTIGIAFFLTFITFGVCISLSFLI